MTIFSAFFCLLRFLAFAAPRSAWLGLLLLLPRLAAAEDARLPYHTLCQMQKAQAQLSNSHPNLMLVLQMRSIQSNVNYTNITAYIDAKAAKVPIVIGEEGVFTVPVKEYLTAEDPWVIVNQPKGTMELSWHAGLAPALVRKMTNSIHYALLMRAARECDEVQQVMRPFFPAAPQLTVVGVRLTFKASSGSVAAPAAVIHAKDGDRVLTATNDLRQLILPLNGDLIEDDPLMSFTEVPVAVEIVTRRTDEGP